MLWLWLLLSLSSAPARDVDTVIPPSAVFRAVPVEAQPRGVQQQRVFEDMKAQKVRGIAVKLADGTVLNIVGRRQLKLQIQSMPDAVLLAAQLGLNHVAAGETGRMIGVHDKLGAVPARIARTTPGAIQVALGPAIEDQREDAPDVVTLRDELGLATLSASGSSWDAASRWLVHDAFGMLDDREREMLRGLTLHRQPEPSGRYLVEGSRRAPANYSHVGRECRIELYDRALAPAETFYGSLKRLHPEASVVILHELGHALAWADTCQAYRAAKQLEAELSRTRDTLNAAVRDYNEAVRVHKESKARADFERAEALGEEVERLRARHAELQATHLPMAKGANREASRVAAALYELLQARHPEALEVTSDPEQLFADFFARFALHPAGLKASHPEVFAWFDTDQHVSPAADQAP
jgi:hypothetical protein